MLHSIDRQKVILDNLKIGSVTSINHLIQKTKFNESTIRRDLKSLAKIQKVMILRGGVVRINQLDDQSIEIENLVCDRRTCGCDRCRDTGAVGARLLLPPRLSQCHPRLTNGVLVTGLACSPQGLVACIHFLLRH